MPCLDMSLGMRPEGFDNLNDNAVIGLCAMAVAEMPKLAEETSALGQEICGMMVNHSQAACAMALMTALAVVIGNIAVDLGMEELVPVNCLDGTERVAWRVGGKN